VVRLLHLPNAKHTLAWLNGLVLVTQPSSTTPKEEASLIEQILIEYNQTTHQLLITGFVPSNKFCSPPRSCCFWPLLTLLMYRATLSTALFTEVNKSINSIIDVYYYTTKSRINTTAGCSHCLNAQPYDPSMPSSAPAIGMIPIEEISTLFINGQSFVPCPLDKNISVGLDRVAPDVCLSNLPIISSTDVTVLEEIGSGGFGLVKRGTYEDKSKGKIDVAIKEVNLQTVEGDPTQNLTKVWGFVLLSL